MNPKSRYLEIIHVRLASGWSDSLVAELRRSVSEQSTGNQLTVFRRVGLSGDIGIYILHSDTVDTPVLSSIGLGLASQLRDLGMVDHSIRVEDEQISTLAG